MYKNGTSNRHTIDVHVYKKKHILNRRYPITLYCRVRGRVLKAYKCYELHIKCKACFVWLGFPASLYSDQIRVRPRGPTGAEGKTSRLIYSLFLTYPPSLKGHANNIFI
jgi:hypothetical protein